MLTTGFSVQGSSLKLLRSGERGMITQINTLCDTTIQSLRTMGLTRGQMITLEQRFPRFIVRVGTNSYALNEIAIRAIYVRIVN